MFSNHYLSKTNATFMIFISNSWICSCIEMVSKMYVQYQVQFFFSCSLILNERAPAIKRSFGIF